MKTLTLTITNIPDSPPGSYLRDLIEITSHVDAPLNMAAVKASAKASIMVQALATELGEMDKDGPKIDLASMVAMFSGVDPSQPDQMPTTGCSPSTDEPTE
jgi:hypothetical protein